MLRKEDWIIISIVLTSIAAIIYFHVRSSTIQKSFTEPLTLKRHSTPAPSSEIEIKFRQKTTQ